MKGEVFPLPSPPPPQEPSAPAPLFRLLASDLSRKVPLVDRSASLLLGLLACLFLSSCFNNKKIDPPLPPKEVLAERVGFLVRFLRWKEFQQAKVFVAPEKQADLIYKWEKEGANLQIVDFTIRDITIIPAKKKGIALLLLQFYRLPSASIQNELIRQRWEVIKGLWYYTGEESPPKKATATEPGEAR